ncbi:MAG: pyridoxine 5'-phosphate synthase [Acidobacteriota bacterium]
MRLSVNIDHFATLREARKSNEPEPVLAALLAEQAGAGGIVCHIREDRRHIKERDLHLLRKTVKTQLNVEMAATKEMKKIALDIKPDTVTLVPEKENELTTEGGLDVLTHFENLKSHIQELRQAGIRVSIFVDPDLKQVEACHQTGVDLIEINTSAYAEAKSEKSRQETLEVIKEISCKGHNVGLEIHAGHGLDYRNISPLADIQEITGFSIGFAIVARSAIVGIEIAVREMVNQVE